MSIERHPDGRRSVRVEVEVPGTPEQVWQAIATGPGISAWFVPTTLEPKVGGTTTCDFGGGMVSSAKITAFEPPFRFAAESPGWAPEMPAMATEWTVEAKGGGRCLVRVVHSMFASTDDWDDQLTGTEHGWPGYFAVLRRYLESFAGQPAAQIQANAMAAAPLAEAWAKFAAGLQLAGRKAGQRVSATVAPGVTIAGVIDRLGESAVNRTLLVRLEEPGPGTLYAGAFGCGGTMVALQAYLYGKGADGIARAAGPKVQEWLAAQFPPAQAAGGEAGCG